MNWQIKFVFVTLFMSIASMSAAQESFQRLCDTIPYELVKGKIIVPATVNGQRVKFILDTGGQMAIAQKEAEQLGIQSSGAGRLVGDISGKKLVYGEGLIRELVLGDHFKIADQKTMITPASGFFKAFDVVGLLSGDALSGCVLTIDSKLRVVVINYPYRPMRLKVTDGAPMTLDNVKHTIVKASIGGSETDVLFDTGAADFLYLAPTDYAKIEATGGTKVLNTAFGISSIGIGGPAAPAPFKKISVNELTFMGKKFENVQSLISANHLTIIGQEMLNYGVVVIDYLRSRFYFLPYDTNIERDIPVHKIWNVAILPIVDRFEVSAVWESMKGAVEVGEQVVNFNGMELAGLPMSQMVIEDMMDTVEGDKAYIMVKNSAGKIRRVDIARE